MRRGNDSQLFLERNKLINGLHIGSCIEVGNEQAGGVQGLSPPSFSSGPPRVGQNSTASVFSITDD